MQREYVKWYSPALSKEIELLAFGHAGTPVLLFPTRTARFYDYENWKIIEALTDKIDAGLLQVFCVDSVDSESFYSSEHPSQRIRRPVNIAFKYPQYFSKVVGLSSRYDLTISSDKFPDLMNGYFDDSVYYNMPSMFIPNLCDEHLLTAIRKLEVTLVIGREDPFYENNIHLERELRIKNIAPNFYVWQDEAHRAKHWRQMVRLYL